jgi:hypothetical protein
MFLGSTSCTYPPLLELTDEEVELTMRLTAFNHQVVRV